MPLVPPGLLDGVDASRAGRDRLPTIPETFTVIDDRSVAWTLSPYPTLGWAQTVYPDLDGAEALEQLWHDIAHICRLDEPDPAAAWQERIEQIWQSALKLDALDLDSLHFDGPGTDLTVGLLPSSRFAKEGGSSQTRTGVRHVPNIPTEEVYTTPDPERTEGRRCSDEAARCRRLARHRLAHPLRGWTRRPDRRGHERGRATTALRVGRRRLEARRGRTRRPREPDRQARANVLSTLLDENAASHLALGDAYSAPVGDASDLPRINESVVHIDFMIGSDDVTVTGTTKAGEQVAILLGGSWQI